MLDRLGPNVWHNSPGAAMAVLEELEETARLWLMVEHKPAPLTEEAIQQLRDDVRSNLVIDFAVPASAPVPIPLQLLLSFEVE